MKKDKDDVVSIRLHRPFYGPTEAQCFRPVRLCVREYMRAQQKHTLTDMPSTSSALIKL